MPAIPQRLLNVSQTIETLVAQLGREGLKIELARRGLIFQSPSAEPCSMARVLWEYQESIDLSPGTVATKKTYNSELTQFEEFIEKEELLESDADEVLTELTYGRYLQRKMADTTRNKKVTFLRNLHNYAIRQRWVNRVVPEVLRTHTVTPNVPRGLSPEAVQELIELTRTTRYAYRYGCLVAVLLATGARIGEIAKLQIQYVDTLSRKAKIFGKNHQEGRYVYFGKPVMELLLDFIEFSFGPDALTDPKYREFYVFSARGGQSAPDISSIEETFRGLVAKMQTITQEEKQHLTPHSLRHTFATTGIDRGIDIYTISQLLGHRSVATTMRYAAVSDKKRQMAAEETQKGLKAGWR